MSEGLSTIELVARLGLAANREKAAQALATHLSADRMLVFVRDPELDTLIPAPGFAQTVRGGPAWRRFLAQCSMPGRHMAQVDLASDRMDTAIAMVPDGIAAVLIGGRPPPGELDTLERLLPLVGVALGAELRARIAQAEAAEARNAASRAHSLATALETARAEAAKYNAQLREEHARKDDFLAMLAHELRNPLSPLVSAVELLRRGNVAPDMLERALDLMGRQINQLTRLIEDLLDVSRVSRGRIELRRERLALREVLEHALEASRPVLQARRHRLDVAVGEAPLEVNADAARLTQVFANLIHNAAKYTDPGGRIRIVAAREGDQAIVKFQDNGIGLSAEMLPRIFDLFAQAPVSLSRSQGGLGIGLTLARSLVELHGGQISAESDGAGRGSTFTVRLPLAGPEAAPARPAAPRAAESAATRALRVLVVDDNQDAANSLATLLGVLGHHAEVAYSALEALQRAEDLDADLMLIDIGLPEIDGYEVGRRLRRITRSDVRFVALTGYGSPEDKRRSREAGFDEHVIKPVMVDALEAIAARTLAGRGAAR